MEVLISNQQNRIAIPSGKLEKTARDILNVLACPDGELSLLIVDDAAMADLNQQYRGRSGPTNVLAFAMNEGDYADVMPQMLGDVVISVDTCQREAQAEGISFDRHFLALLIHGILHLFGYDHETSEEDERRMTDKSRDVLQRLDELA